MSNKLIKFFRDFFAPINKGPLLLQFPMAKVGQVIVGVIVGIIFVIAVLVIDHLTDGRGLF